MQVYYWHERKTMLRSLLAQEPFNRGSWQAMDVSKSKAHDTYEMEDVTILVPEIPTNIPRLQDYLRPDLPWAEDHFRERVSGIPHNPPPSAARWPYAVRGHGDHTDTAGRFDHTYPERFWPKHTGEPTQVQYPVMPGIRFPYGDASDVAELLVRDPFTRQAFLPVWFPEDTGAVSGQRVPCTIGYHFMRNQHHQLTCRYYIRSCDVRRHLTNDVYLTCRLVQWMSNRVNSIMQAQDREEWELIPELVPGHLTMHVGSLHAFRADKKWIEGQI